MREREREGKIVIWALYDDAEQSYYKSIKKFFNNYNLEVHSIGINNLKSPKSNKYFYHRIDLSLNNINLIKELKKISDKPNIILASPPCESWSGADCNGRMTRKIDKDGNWIVKNKFFYDNEYNQNCHPVKRRYFINKERTRLIGESTIGATIEIIQTFKPDIWIIENPATSKIWEFQENHWDFHGFKNKTYYSSYDENFSLKPTIFKSNMKLNLKDKTKKNSNKNHMALGNYSKRSSIPKELIKDIINQILNSKEGERKSYGK